MSDFEVRFDNLPPFVKRMQGAESIIKDEMVKATDRLTLQGEGFAKAEAPVDTGNLKRSITATPATWAGGGVTGKYGTATPYAPHVEYGTKPHFPPTAALRGWAGRHGFPAKGGAYLVARAISRRGTKAKPFIRPSLQRLRPFVPREYNAAVKRIVGRLGGS